jgi:hypothetical protein
MILLQTLTRMHICFTLLVSQVIGSIATMCARSFAPNNIGPGPISPDITAGVGALGNAWFWIALLLQLLIWYVRLTWVIYWVLLLKHDGSQLRLPSFLPAGATFQALM